MTREINNTVALMFGWEITGLGAATPSDFAERSMVMGIAYHTAEDAGTHDIRAWTQAKIGGAWFDIPSDLRANSATAGPGAADQRKRNLDTDGKGLLTAIYKHFPFSETRVAMANDTGSPTFPTLTSRAIGEAK